ncbi:TetR/AcrR family transcriptional regulator [Streptomyces lydicus]|uniref:TetR/AcrR family transcriptional regulator n=1 Tax=Streptomyces lydicus TaxID=47763 RepID=UPI0037A77A30
MNNSQQRGRGGSQTARGTVRSQARRAELIATGRRLFADTSYDTLSMDDIARQAGVAKGLIYYYFTNKRGYYLAIIEDAVAELVERAGSTHDLPPVERVQRTVDGYLRYAQHHQAAYRAIVTGGVGFGAEVMAIRDAVRARLLGTIALGAWGRTDLPPADRGVRARLPGAAPPAGLTALEGRLRPDMRAGGRPPPPARPVRSPAAT